MSKYLLSRRTMRHRQGSKEYHFLAIENVEKDVALVVLRWGKTGAWGQMQVHVGNRDKIQDLFLKKTREKEKGGYTQIANNSTEVSRVEEVKKLATLPYWSKLGADNIKKVMPEADTKGVTDPVELTDDDFEEGPDGKIRKKHKIKEHPDFVETEATRAARELREAQELQAKDPLWGMF
jgi:predicted DNA-binding WGR domain protein